MMHAACRVSRLAPIFVVALISFTLMFAEASRAVDLPLAAASPLSGVAFDDKPLLLPVQRNFQMAMLTAGSELGRSCGRIEAYGWRMGQTEQGRVNQIFNNTVDRLRLLGYVITPQTLTSVSNDITLFTADRPEKHFIFLWSAGELGLVMNLCETSGTAIPALRAATHSPSVQVFPLTTDVFSPRSTKPTSLTQGITFSPLGRWVGSYVCSQGYTGGTLEVTHVSGTNFEGQFRFYPLPRNPNVPAGSYTISGEYDPQTKRVLINPGRWISRPHNYYNTVIVGRFDTDTDTFSGFFQGISGCTSFEGKHDSEPYLDKGLVKPLKKPAHHAVKTKKHVAAKGREHTPKQIVSGTVAPAPSAQLIVPVATEPLSPASSTPGHETAAPVAVSNLTRASSLPPSGDIPVPPKSSSAITGLAIPSAPPALPPEDKSGGISLSAPTATK